MFNKHNVLYVAKVLQIAATRNTKSPELLENKGLPGSHKTVDSIPTPLWQGVGCIDRVCKFDFVSEMKGDQRLGNIAFPCDIFERNAVETSLVIQLFRNAEYLFFCCHLIIFHVFSVP